MDKLLKNKKIRLIFREDIEPQEAFLDNLARKKEQDFGISEKKIEAPLSKNTFRIFLLAIFALFGFLFAKTFQLQVLKKNELTAKADENRFIFSQLRANRGVIYDQNMNQLVFNKPCFDLTCQKSNLPKEQENKNKVLKEISQITGIQIQDLEKEIEESSGPEVIIAENLDHQTLIMLETKTEELPGFNIKNKTIRQYIKGEVFAHILGYEGRIKKEESEKEPEFYSVFDYLGRDGLEKSYENILRKVPGELQTERDTFGNEISKKIVRLPAPGKSLVLWLKADLQEKLKQALEQGLETAGAAKGAAIAIDPKTGGVLALVSLPGFDNNSFSAGESKELKTIFENPDEPLFNRAISGQYPTGSTIKPLTALAALQEKIISPDQRIYCDGKIEVKDFWNPEKTWQYKDWRPHGWTDLRKAIAESCNVFFYILGGGYKNQQGLGPTKIKEYLELFGWGQKTGIDLPAEAKGFIPDKEWKQEMWGTDWWDGETYLLSIGQGYLLITPLQVAASFVSIANQGTLYKPQIVKEIIDSEKNLIKEIEPEIIRQDFLDQENIQVVREGMRQAVTGKNSPHASAVLLNSLPVEAAAKTGTAQTPKQEVYHNWVTVFAPYDDPEIVLTIMLEDVKGMQTAALPVAKEVLEWYFTR